MRMSQRIPRTVCLMVRQRWSGRVGRLRVDSLERLQTWMRGRGRKYAGRVWIESLELPAWKG